MNIANRAIKIIESESPSVDIDWLEFVSQDFESGELSAEQCYQLTKGFIRGLMATKAIGVEVLDDIEQAYKTTEVCDCGSIFYDDTIGMCRTCFDRIKNDDSGCDDVERYI